MDGSSPPTKGSARTCLVRLPVPSLPPRLESAVRSGSRALLLLLPPDQQLAVQLLLGHGAAAGYAARPLEKTTSHQRQQRGTRS
jgi:hypothetical protein